MVSTLEAGITKTTKRVTISNVNLDSHSRSCGNWNDDLKVRCFENPSRKFVERKGYEEGNVNEENKIGEDFDILKDKRNLFLNSCETMFHTM